MFCDVILGTEISPEMKGRLSSELTKFQRKGKGENKGYVLGLIGSPADRHLLEKQATDLSICLLANSNPKQQQIQADLCL